MPAPREAMRSVPFPIPRKRSKWLRYAERMKRHEPSEVNRLNAIRNKFFAKMASKHPPFTRDEALVVLADFYKGREFKRGK